eukprot:CAMPEP_0198309294 /NCGR_PEP_ID=MMETSP1450-20131203/1722_1 /TAXON_ID=753684 ORGANISM="Madagascaria erythrocladiodes, Strain CCMP3234" /NCGR_SAMPLE_ID=MMETSP1450 /ASSEMBLY_ACC=CAM_ASM_001115 /LENGTH=357 /DNA_ID=CAMNT_0044012045 /DNA_START=19 /DNA_END=1092 /DNA_ORIENTATION=+
MAKFAALLFCVGFVCALSHAQGSNATELEYRSRAVLRDGGINQPDATRWPDGVVYFKFANAVPADERDLITQAMEAISESSCITFQERTNQPDFIRFINNLPGCQSEIGRVGGRQTINLDSVCFGESGNSIGTAIHQLLHSLGFAHEMNRPDRDKFVEVLNGNIAPAFQFLYDKETDESVDSHGTRYDYGSIMHFRTDAFPASPGLTTMNILKPFGGEIGQRNGLSNGDKVRLNRAYNCPGLKGKSGTLRITVKKGRNLPTAETFVRIAAWNTDGNRVVRKTSTKSGSTTPNYNEELNFGSGTWAYLRLSVVATGGAPKPTLVETTGVVKGVRNTKHCRAPGKRRCGEGQVKYTTTL